MTKFFYPLAVVVLLITSCDNKNQSTSTDQSQDTTDVSNFSLPKAKTLDSSQIPKYTVFTAQSGSDGIDEIRQPSNIASCSNSIPTKISDLSSNSYYDLYQFRQDKSAEAKAMGFNGSIGKKELLIVEDYTRWKEVECDGKKRKFGIGLRCFIHVTEMKGGVEGALSAISAKVELKSGKATFNLKSLGFAIDGSTIADGLSSSGQYDVENFAKLRVIYNNTLRTLSDTSSKKISPVELPE